MVIVDPGRFIEIITAFLQQGGKTPGFCNVVAPRAGAFRVKELPDVTEIRHPDPVAGVVLTGIILCYADRMFFHCFSPRMPGIMAGLMLF